MRKLAILLASLAALAVVLWLLQGGSGAEPELATPDMMEAGDTEEASALDAPLADTRASNGAREAAEPAVAPAQEGDAEVVTKSARAHSEAPLPRS